LRIKKMTSKTWREALADDIEPELLREIDAFAQQIEMKRDEKMPDSVFGETRLRRGVYGQRYDNGQRHDGVESKSLEFPSGDATKGPNTLWDAPGMQRIKIPYGGITAAQLELMADLSEEYSDGITHVTTRQDLQLHYIHLEDTPDLMYRLAASGITTREACGNTIRNITACPYAGVCAGETFDVTPHAHAAFEYLLGHPDCQDFGRKFKIAFSGCADEPCGLTRMHDLGFVARTRVVDGVLEKGFEVHVAGGLGAVPHTAKVYTEFMPLAELLPFTVAVCRVFAQHGEQRNRARARLKFLVAKIGFDAFAEMVTEERARLEPDPRWTSVIADAEAREETASRPGEALVQLPKRGKEAFDRWRRTNVRTQRQPGYATVMVMLPLGDASPEQLRSLADITRRYTGDNIRTTVEQNFLLRWVSEVDLPEVHAALDAIGLAEPEADTIRDITACPGTDTCKLGTSSSRGLAEELRDQIASRDLATHPAVEALKIKISGCFNSCAQHHVADIGFYGVSRKREGHVVPHFQVVVGGRWSHNAGAFGQAIGAVPSKAIPDALERLAQAYVDARDGDEGFGAWVERVGRAHVKALIKDLCTIPALSEDPTFYSDWGDPRRFSTGDMAKGECAGEVVPLAEFGLAASEQAVFEAQLHLEKGASSEAAKTAHSAMLTAAKALVQTQERYVADDDDVVVERFRAGFCDTGLFHDRFAGAKFANYLLKTHGVTFASVDRDRAHQKIEEASLFVEAAHACYLKLNETA